MNDSNARSLFPQMSSDRFLYMCVQWADVALHPEQEGRPGVLSVWVKGHGGGVPLWTFCLYAKWSCIIMICQAYFRNVQGMQCNLTASWHSYSHFLGRLRRGTQIHNGILQTCIFIVHTSFCCGSCLQPGSPGKSINTSGPCFVCCGLTVILNSPGQGEVPPVPPLDYVWGVHLL